MVIKERERDKVKLWLSLLFFGQYNNADAEDNMMRD